MKYAVKARMKAFEALRKLYPDSSRRTLQTWLKKGRFTVDGLLLERENTWLEAGQTLCSQEAFRPPRIPGLKILYEDRALIAIDKPVGLLSVPLDEGKAHHRHALGLLRQHFGTDQIFAVHRIDREASGVLIFARGKEAEERLDVLFERHDLRREYFAIVEGRVKEESGTWKSYLKELPSLDVVEAAEGKLSITHFHVLRRSAKYTYLKLILETGRKHQIRVHCQMAGHSIVGDRRYGSVESPMRRLCLHATSLGLIHPFTQKPLCFQSPLPPSFQVLGGNHKISAAMEANSERSVLSRNI